MVLIEYLKAAGNTQAKIDHWISYAAEMTAMNDETPGSVIESEVIMVRMQERIRQC